MADAGVEGLTVLEGDAVEGVVPGRSVLTDGYRARERWFGATRGQDVSSDSDPRRARGQPRLPTLARAGPPRRRDRRRDRRAGRQLVPRRGPLARRACAPPPVPGRRSTATRRPPGSPSSTTPRRCGSRSTRRARSAPSGSRSPTTADGGGAASGCRRPCGSRPTRGSGPWRCRPRGPSRCAAPPGPTRSLVVRVLDTDRGAPSGVLTGLAEVQVDGLTTREVVVAPAGGARRIDAVLLDRGLPGSDGCVLPAGDVVCFGDQVRDPEGGADLVRRVAGPGGAELTASGTMTVSPWAEELPGLAVPGVEVTASSSRTRAPSARPEAVVDGDEATAWSPAADDRSPTLRLHLDAPADVGGIRLEGRRAWFARHRPVVQVVLDGREEVVRATAEGFLAVRGAGVRVIELTFLPDVGRARGATASLELSGVDVAGLGLPAPAARVDRPCGQGPVLRVDGTEVPTRLDGPRSALWGDGALRWTACGPVHLDAGATHEIEVRGGGALRPDTVALVAPGATRAPATTAVPARRPSPTHVTATLGAGPQRLLAMAGNHNAGWRATLDGRPLRPVVVDGFRQGFVVPDGASGALDAELRPRPPLPVGPAGRAPARAPPPDRRAGPRAGPGSSRARSRGRPPPGDPARRHRRHGRAAPRAVGGPGGGRDRRGGPPRPPLRAVPGALAGGRGRVARRRRGGPRRGDRPGGVGPCVGRGCRCPPAHVGAGARRRRARRPAARMAGCSTRSRLSQARPRLTGTPTARSGTIPPLKTRRPTRA